MLLALKRISRQRDALPALLAPEMFPIRLNAGNPQPAQSLQHGSGIGGVGSTIRHRRHNRYCAISALLARQNRQRLPRPHFKQHSFRLIEQQRRRVREAHWLAAMLSPIAGADRVLRLDPRSRHSGDIRNRGRMKGNPANLILECVEHRIHHGGMEGVRSSQALEFAPLPLQSLFQFLNGIHRAGCHA